MERNVEFKNFTVTKIKITAEMFCDENYVMEIGCKLDELDNNSESPVALYKYFRHAAKIFLKISSSVTPSDTIH